MDITTMTQELINRVTRLEVQHEERHKQTLNLMGKMESTQERIADSVASLVHQQEKMVHLGEKTDELDRRQVEQERTINNMKIHGERLKTRQNVMWGGLGAMALLLIGAVFKVILP